MFNFLNQFAFLVAQVGGSPSGGAAKEAVDSPAGDEPSSFFSQILIFAPAILGVMLVYFLLSSRPQKKQQAKAKELLDSVKKNDRVLTAGGILGTVVNKDDNEYLTIRVDDSSNVKLQVLKSSIVRVVKDDDEKSDAKKS